MPTLNLATNWRVGAVGRTGMGKTFLMEKLLRDQPRVIVIDSKHRVRWHGYHLTDDPRAALIHNKIIYRPPEGELPPEWFWTEAMDILHEKGGGIIYVDELAEITTPSKAPKGFKTVNRLGREIGVGIWWAAQESTAVNNAAIRNCDILIVFLNIGASDRDKLIQTMGDMGEATKDLDPYEFMVFQSNGKAYDSGSIPVLKYEV